MPRQGYIYLFRRNDGWYKIGRTRNLEQRFRSWRWQARKYDPTLLFLVKVDRPESAEHLFQAIFADKRTVERHHGLGPCHELFKLMEKDLYVFKNWADIIGTKTTTAYLPLNRKTWLKDLRELVDDK